MTVYGPYTRKDGRKHVVLYDPITQERTTVSYPKYLMEQKLGRPLKPNETVDHKDGDFTNDAPDNLRIKTRSENAKLGVKRNKPQIFNCPTCSISFALAGKKLYDANIKKKKGKAGPFCSRSCAGKYGKGIQLGTQQKLQSNAKPIEKFTIQKMQVLFEG